MTISDLIEKIQRFISMHQMNLMLIIIILASTELIQIHQSLSFFNRDQTVLINDSHHFLLFIKNNYKQNRFSDSQKNFSI